MAEHRWRGLGWRDYRLGAKATGLSVGTKAEGWRTSTFCPP